MTIESLDKAFVLSSYGRNYTSFVEGKGAKLYDDKGKEYIDFASGIGVSSVGHGNEILVSAICSQAQRLIHTSNLQVIEPQAKLAEQIVGLSGYDMRCFFGNSGAEANEAAIKIARKHGKVSFDNGKFDKKRYKVITLEHSFHGRTITTVRATGQDSFHSPNFSPYPEGFSYVSTIDDVYGHVDDETVAVLIELVQGEGGVQPFEKAEIQKLARDMKSRGILLMVDEVQTGIYRTGEFLASNLYDIEPDVITLAKGLAGGIPIGVAMTNLKDIFEPGDHGSTFGGNYISTSAGLAVLEVLGGEKDSGALDERIELFRENLERIVTNYPKLFSQSVGIGLMLGLRARDSKI
ncbi:MAG TPA: aminotransferase class III-fold pyridoxal phosphate-dependent enzyme, partial [Sulfurovum sp.]|nr:aminotransferase class III-fold pyridoxal phosphate-dependent enzyme [Sulfurovum sp.]